MSYVLIAKEAHTLPFAVNLDVSSVDEALVKVADVETAELRSLFAPLMLVEVGTGEVIRVVRRGADGPYEAAGMAYEKLGEHTRADYFDGDQK